MDQFPCPECESLRTRQEPDTEMKMEKRTIAVFTCKDCGEVFSTTIWRAS